jgi:hypothetical protein
MSFSSLENVHANRSLAIPLLTFYHYVSDSQWAGRFGDQIPVGERFTSPVHTVPATHSATGSCPVIKWPGRGLDHPPNLVPRLKKE